MFICGYRFSNTGISGLPCKSCQDGGVFDGKRYIFSVTFQVGDEFVQVMGIAKLDTVMNMDGFQGLFCCLLCVKTKVFQKSAIRKFRSRKGKVSFGPGQPINSRACLSSCGMIEFLSVFQCRVDHQ